MTETCSKDQTQRQVIRHADFNLPEHWEVQSDTIAQFPVKTDSPEYQQIRALFDQTMSTKYTEILHIDRIQNKQWYMQYSSYKSFSPKQQTERMLFHGCPRHLAQLIIHSFFNRSFAGVNGLFHSLSAFSKNGSVFQVFSMAKVLIFLLKLVIVMDMPQRMLQQVNDVCL